MKIDRFLPLVIIGFSLVSRIAAETPAKPARSIAKRRNYT